MAAVAAEEGEPRHLRPAILNAASPDIGYPFTVTEIQSAVNAALTSGDADEIEALKNDLDAANNLHGTDICED